METIRIAASVYKQIMDTIGRLPPECGGVLGAAENGFITEYYFDSHGKSAPNGYAPDIQSINRMLTDDWMPRGILMVGIVHSHSNGIAVPSCGDFSYGIRILQALDTVDEFYLPIVTQTDGKVRLDCYAICHDPERQFICRKVDYVIADSY